MAILQDLAGPKIRTGRLAEGGTVTLVPGARLVLTNRDVPGSAKEVGLTYPDLPLERARRATPSCWRTGPWS